MRNASNILVTVNCNANSGCGGRKHTRIDQEQKVNRCIQHSSEQLLFPSPNTEYSRNTSQFCLLHKQAWQLTISQRKAEPASTLCRDPPEFSHFFKKRETSIHSFAPTCPSPLLKASTAPKSLWVGFTMPLYRRTLGCPENQTSRCCTYNFLSKKRKGGGSRLQSQKNQQPRGLPAFTSNSNTPFRKPELSP